ncbi:discoidin domain-containing protein [Hahella sp. NBU794]|uniref:discoidin domain-containing protein n=1 Tax=Hahella sp. NBU794 TaxID=3422590 RepID=UPI003D6F1062
MISSHWRRHALALSIAAGAGFGHCAFAAENLAHMRPVTTSSVESSDLSGYMAVDGDASTRWGSAYGNSAWIYVDLGEKRSISRVRLTWEAAYAKAYDIQVSNDASSWTTVRSVTNADGDIDDLSNLNATGRYLRIKGKKRGTEYGYSLWEIEVYGADSNNGGEKSVMLYEDTHFKGYAVELPVGDYNLTSLISRGALNDDLSSARVPNGLKLEVFQHNNFKGVRDLYTSDAAELNRDDDASSVRVSKTETTDGGSDERPDWQSGHNYVEGDIVRYKGKLYIAVHANPGYDPVISHWFWDEYQGGEDGGDSGDGNDDGDNGDDSGANCAAGNNWNEANLTNYESYPDPNSEECIKYNGCEWAGQFAGLDGVQPESWVKAHNIAAVHSKDFNWLNGKTLRLRQGGKEIDVIVYDMCADSDCDGCCTQNLGRTGYLIDIEKYTMQRFGTGSGTVQWQVCD